MEADIGTIFFSMECAQGGMRFPPHSPLPPLPPPPLLHRVAAKQHCTNFAKHKILTKLFWISRNFAKLQKQIFLQPSYSYTICCLLHKLPSAKTIFCCAAMLLWDEADICTVVFHSVIFNSVHKTLYPPQIFHHSADRALSFLLLLSRARGPRISGEIILFLPIILLQNS